MEWIRVHILLSWCMLQSECSYSQDVYTFCKIYHHSNFEILFFIRNIGMDTVHFSMPYCLLKGSLWAANLGFWRCIRPVREKIPIIIDHDKVEKPWIWLRIWPRYHHQCLWRTVEEIMWKVICAHNIPSIGKIRLFITRVLSSVRIRIVCEHIIRTTQFRRRLIITDHVIRGDIFLSDDERRDKVEWWQWINMTIND